ncbi:MAG TPA: N-6 DNA methylase [Caulobacterales bacterium]|nr:N-6 DNA methylase [Caulobacterales bacterium]
MREICDRLVRRNVGRTEADIQADVRQLILAAPFNVMERQLVMLESPVGDGRRIDIEVGSTCIEVKRDVRTARSRADAIGQLAGYISQRRDQTAQRYAGVLTDGADWYCYDLVGPELREVSHFKLSSSADADRLVVWLEGVLATTARVIPTPTTIQNRLGAESSSYALDRATVAALYAANRERSTVKMKRTLWARLLTSALGTQFEDTDDLFIEHTLLVNSAEIIAHAVLGIDVSHVSASDLLSGEVFDQSGIFGVVEPDFFDWVVEVEGGDTFIRTLARRLARFEWSGVEQDVLKVLYESIIGAETRKRLGEYYTPDWLAESMVDASASDPLGVRLLDPACGSGTFLFYAIRKYLAASAEAGRTLAETIAGVTNSVIGMDLHPVAVTLARVTYVLAIGRDRLVAPDRPAIQIPVYLGDSLQMQDRVRDLWSANQLVIETDDGRELFANELRFPADLLRNAARFDQLVGELTRRASERTRGTAPPSLSAVFQRFAVSREDRPTLEATFEVMCRLHDADRNHIWGYYVRNLARPMWLSLEENKVDLLVGNPPWLAYRFMPPAMQTAFQSMSAARGIWAGAEFAAHQDLSALFVVRASELYLRRQGRFALVMPNAAIDRVHYEGFRSGSYGDASGGLQIAFGTAWDLRRLRPHFFPRAASVVFGLRAEERQEMPIECERWEGRVTPNAHWADVRNQIVRSIASLRRTGEGERSPYHELFTQGAVFLPRFMFVVTPAGETPLGRAAGSTHVRSERSSNEKAPWKTIPPMTGVIESQFLRPLVSGETVLPFRVRTPLLAVVPCTARARLTSEQIDVHPGLGRWWAQASSTWEQHRNTDTLTLAEQLDFQNKLTKQLPIPELRVVYNRSGMNVVGAKVRNRQALINSSLYWMPAFTEEEADYLCAFLNAPSTTEQTRPLMSYGKDERDIAKHIWELAIPRFDPNNVAHSRLAVLGSSLEALAAEVNVAEDRYFVSARADIRRALDGTPESAEADDIVIDLLG